MIGSRTSPDEAPALPEWTRLFPALRDVSDPQWVETAGNAKELVVPPDTTIFSEGDPCHHYIFMLEGATRVFKAFETGREMVLYRLGPGETCSLTTTVLLGGGAYPANAVTEVETRAVVIPAREFQGAFDGSKGFRDFVCRTFGSHVRDLIVVIEAVAMRHVDVRLARWLLDNRDAESAVTVSHRELAIELGTAREVVSRHLKDFEKRGWVELSRKRIAIRQSGEMRDLVAGCRAFPQP